MIDVREEAQRRVDVHAEKDAAKHLSGGTDERSPALVLILARRFAHEDEPSVEIAVAGDDVGARSV